MTTQISDSGILFNDGTQIQSAINLGMRNRIINGGGFISQRGLTTAVTAGGVYGADRWIHYVAGGTGITAIGGADISGLGNPTGRYIYINGTWTTGAAGFAQRIEAANCTDLNSKTVTVSGKIYQNTGSTQPFSVKLLKANASDNFTATTLINTVSAGSIPSGVLTPFTATFTLGASDASNGIQLGIEMTNAVTVTSKIIGVAEVQLELGSTATPFEQRPYGLELALCQRYGEPCPEIEHGGYGNATNVFGYRYSFKTTKRANPSPETSLTFSSSNGTASYLSATTSAIRVSFTVSSTTAFTFNASNSPFFSAEL